MGNEHHLRQALDDFRNKLTNSNASDVISRFCGSQIVIAQGLGLTLLTASWLAILLLKPSEEISIGILVTNFALYFLLRWNLGAAIQKKYFLLTDFNNFKVHSITQVKKRPYTEKGAVHFVKTSFQ